MCGRVMIRRGVSRNGAPYLPARSNVPGCWWAAIFHRGHCAIAISSRAFASMIRNVDCVGAEVGGVEGAEFEVLSVVGKPGRGATREI